MKIAFRIEVGKDVGLGHIQRSTALAHEFKERGLYVDIFVPNNSLPIELKQELIKDFFLCELKHNNDFNVFRGYDYLITDSYKIDTSYLKKLIKQVSCLISIDDSNRIEFPVDYFINAALYAKELTYRFAKTTKPLLGTRYFLLRRGLKRKKNWRLASVKKMFLSLGASNSKKIQKILFRVIKELKKILPKEMESLVIVGPYFKNLRQKSFPNITFYRFPSFINNLMASADLAISAGGQTLYELAYLGVPTIGICMEEDQEMNLETFSRAGYCLYAGWAESKKTISILKKSLDIFLTDSELRENMSKRQLKLIDGLGPKRVTDEILS